MLAFVKSLPMWIKLAGGGMAGLIVYDKLIVKKPVFPPGFLGKLSPKLAPKVASAINSSENPSVLRQLADGLSKAGAPIAASIAHAKADTIETTQAPFSRTISELTIPGIKSSSTNAPTTSSASTTTAPNLAQVVAQAVSATGLAPVIPATVRLGSRGAEVLQAQALLGIAADGIFGPQTQLAVKAYQSHHGLSADGVIGPQTWKALLSGT